MMMSVMLMLSMIMMAMMVMMTMMPAYGQNATFALLWPQTSLGVEGVRYESIIITTIIIFIFTIYISPT